jgi:type I restriction enzyme S subunit
MNGYSTSIRLRFLLRERDQRGASQEEVLSVYRDLGVIPKGDRNDNFNKTPEDLSNYKLVLPGDVVVNKMKAWQGSVAVSTYRGIVSGDYLVCEVVGQVDRRFLHYLLRSRPLIDEYGQRSTGIRPSQWRLYWDDLASIRVSLPSLETQASIATHLDTEIARIDALIAKKRYMIELLEKRFQSLTDELVSHGMVVPLGHLAKVQVSNVDKLAVEGQQPVQLCNYIDVYHNFRITDDLPFMNATATPEQIARFALKAGDVIITKDSEMADDIGVPAFVPSDLPNTVCGYHLALLRVHDKVVDSSYLFWALRSLFVRRQFTVAATGVTRFGLRSDLIRRVAIPVPDHYSQTVIANRLWYKADCSRTLSMTLTRQIDLLSEHKQALITAVVTGNLEIPTVEATT